MVQIPFLAIFGIIVLVSGDSYGPPSTGYGPPGGQGGSDNAHYNFDYSVNDPNTQDIKSQREQRTGHQVTGEYSLKEADGTTRVVKYKADQNGFEAVVERTGQAQHPASYGKQGGGQMYGGGQAYGVPAAGGTGGISNVGITQWDNQGSDQGHTGYGP